MNKKERIKNFVEDHKFGIAYFAGALTNIIGVTIGFKIYNRKSKNLIDVKSDGIYRVLKSAIDDFDKPANVFSGICDIPLEPSRLGELGKAILRNGGTNDTTFTHFIAIGEDK